MELAHVLDWQIPRIRPSDINTTVYLKPRRMDRAVKIEEKTRAETSRNVIRTTHHSALRSDSKPRWISTMGLCPDGRRENCLGDGEEMLTWGLGDWGTWRTLSPALLVSSSPNLPLSFNASATSTSFGGEVDSYLGVFFQPLHPCQGSRIGRVEQQDLVISIQGPVCIPAPLVNTASPQVIVNIG